MPKIKRSQQRGHSWVGMIRGRPRSAAASSVAERARKRDEKRRRARVRACEEKINKQQRETLSKLKFIANLMSQMPKPKNVPKKPKTRTTEKLNRLKQLVDNMKNAQKESEEEKQRKKDAAEKAAVEKSETPAAAENNDNGMSFFQIFCTFKERKWTSSSKTHLNNCI